MNMSGYQFSRDELSLIDDRLKKILGMCGELSALSADKGGIAAIDQAVVRVSAALRTLGGVADILEVWPEA